MKLQESCSTISVAKLNEYLSVFVLVNGSKIGTKTFASLYVVCKANKTGLNGRQSSTHFLCTLQETYIIPCLVTTDFRYLRVSSDILLESTSFLQILSMRLYMRLYSRKYHLLQ